MLAGRDLRRPPIDREMRNPVPVLKRKELNQPRGVYAGNLLDALLEFVIPANVSVTRDVQREDVVGNQSGWSGLQMEECAQQQACTDQQDESQRNLSHNQPVAKTAAPGAAAPARL